MIIAIYDLLLSLITMITCYLAIIVGLSAFYLLNRFNYLNLITLTFAGAVLGVVTLTMIFIPFNGFDNVGVQLLRSAVLDFIVSLSFGLVAGVKAVNNDVRLDRKYWLRRVTAL